MQTRDSVAVTTEGAWDPTLPHPPMRCRVKGDENNYWTRLLVLNGNKFKCLRCNDIFSGWHLPGVLVCHQSQMVDSYEIRWWDWSHQSVNYGQLSRNSRTYFRCMVSYRCTKLVIWKIPVWCLTFLVYPRCVLHRRADQPYGSYHLPRHFWPSAPIFLPIAIFCLALSSHSGFLFPCFVRESFVCLKVSFLTKI